MGTCARGYNDGFLLPVQRLQPPFCVQLRQATAELTLSVSAAGFEAGSNSRRRGHHVKREQDPNTPVLGGIGCNTVRKRESCRKFRVLVGTCVLLYLVQQHDPTINSCSL